MQQFVNKFVQLIFADKLAQTQGVNRILVCKAEITHKLVLQKVALFV